MVATTVVDQPLMWSPLEKAFSSRRGVADVVRGVAGRVDRLDRPARALDELAALGADIGAKWS